MANPFSQPLGGLPSLSRNPFLAGPSADDMLPPLEDEERRSLVARGMEESLGGLAYVGKVADKTFGGRAVRGLLGGNLRELASVLPLSDSLGITREEDTVSGRTLLENAGVLSPDDDPDSFDLLGGDALGLLAEVALDPSSYLGLGAATKGLGTLAKRAGAAKGFRSKAAGFAARESDLERAIGALPAPSRVGVRPQDILRQYGIDGDILPKSLEAEAARLGFAAEPQFVADPTGRLIDNPLPATGLASGVRLGLPFTGLGADVLSGPAAVKALDFLGDNAAARTLGSLPGAAAVGSALGRVGREASALFEAPVLGARTAEGQSLAREKFARDAALKRATAGVGADLETELAGILSPAGDAAADEAIRRSVIDAGETPADLYTTLAPAPSGFGPFSPADIERRRSIDPAAAAAFLGGPDELARYAAKRSYPALGALPALPLLDKVTDIAARTRGVFDDALRREEALGIDAKTLRPGDVGYFTRSLQEYPEELVGPGSPLDDLRGGGGGFSARNASMSERIAALALPGGQSQVNRLAADPRLAGKSRTLTAQQVKGELRKILSGAENPPFQIGTPHLKPGDPGYLPAVIDPSYAQAEALADILLEVPDEAVKAGGNYFSTDVASLARLRSGRADRSTSTAEAVLDALAREGRPASRLKNPVPMGDVLRAFALTGKDAAGAPLAPQIVANRTGAGAAALNDLALEGDLVKDLMGFNARKEVVPETAGRDAWDWLTRLTKSSLTSPFPAFHVRNLASGLYGGYRSGAFGETPGELFKSLNPLDRESLVRRADDYLEGRGLRSSTGLSDDELWKELVQAGVLDNRQGPNADALGALGETLAERTRRPAPSPGRTTLGLVADDIKSGLDPRSYLKRPETIEDLPPIKAGRAVGQRVEDRLRAAQYLGLRERGYTAEAADALVKKYQFDYQNLSRFEKDVMRRVAPFYSFSRRNLPALAADAVEQPGVLTAPLRVATGSRTRGEFVPAYVAEEASIPVPGGPEGGQRYVSSLGLPFEDGLVKILGSLGRGDIGRAAQLAGGQASPYLQAPAEAAFGRSLYTGRPLEELKPYASLDAVLGDKTARIATSALAKTPLSRLFSSADKATDSRKEALIRLLNLGSGIRVSDVDTERAELAAAKAFLGEELLGQPGVKTAQEVYVPKRNIPLLGERDAVNYRALTMIDQEIRELMRRRLEAGL